MAASQSIVTKYTALVEDLLRWTSCSNSYNRWIVRQLIIVGLTTLKLIVGAVGAALNPHRAA